MRWQIVKTGSSFASQSELPLTFGLGDAMTVDAVRVIWPGGLIDEIDGTTANQLLIIEEGRGVLRATPIVRGQG